MRLGAGSRIKRPREDTVSAQPEPVQQPASGLSARDERILAFERQWWRHVGAKEEAIRAEFGLSAARYYQLLNVLIDSPDAVRHDPMLVGRLQRARDARTRARSARAFRAPDQGGIRPHDM
jgi:hypothetical protein